MPDETIQHVSDTALWVAHYRALETERKDALFRDPLAHRLVGERGRKIAENMKGSIYTSWSLVIRTCIIDAYIKELISLGVDTIVNLGAGLDTRPYRLELPASLRWIEVDYPHMIQHKEDQLGSEKPHCRLERIKLDLADRPARSRFLESLRGKVLVLTEGVVPYLSNDQVGELAQDLRSQENIQYWILDYFAPGVLRYMKKSKMRKLLKNAPFQFEPSDWVDFFGSRGWKISQKRYLGLESLRLGRKIPAPWWVAILRFLTPPKKRENFLKFTGYFVLSPSTKS